MTKPLTAKEKKSGKWAVEEPRILFEGTLEEAEEFYKQTEKIPGLLNTPFAKYTDGLPVVIPTEERVKEMLDRHQPQAGRADHPPARYAGRGAWTRRTVKRRKKGDAVKFMPMFRTATVEQVAVNAVMAGCKPEYFPVVLAIAESGGGTGDGRGGGGAFIVSGPIYKEIGMNVSNNIFGPGNPANKTIGRVGSLMWRNLGGYKETVTTITTIGNPVTNGGFIFAEYAEGLPPGWKGLNEELGFKKKESVLMTVQAGRLGHRPGAHARRVPLAAEDRSRRHRQVPRRQRHPRPAQLPGVPHQRHLGLPRGRLHHSSCRRRWPRTCTTTASRPKQSIYECFWKKSFEPVRDYRMRGTAGRAHQRLDGHRKDVRQALERAVRMITWCRPAATIPSRATTSSSSTWRRRQTARFGGGHGEAYSIDAWR